MLKILYVERAKGPFASIEKVFREIARNLPERFRHEFQQLPYGWRAADTVSNLLFFKPEKADVYHITGHVHYIAMRLPPERTVLSIMDVRFVVLNRGLRRWVLKKLYLDWPLKRMRYVTAISMKVKEEIVELTGCEPEKIRVLDLPLLSHIEPAAERPFDREKPTILQIGTMVNKNVVRLAEALKGLSCRLVVVGELSEEQLEALGRSSIEFENFAGVSDDEIRELYAAADIVAFCSTYEGFGLPIIEAQAMRKPLVTSNISPLKDVAGDGACLVDPFSPESIREGVLSLTSDEQRRKAVVEAGVKNVKRFAPANVSAQYVSLYDEILEALA
jgi:glycosyltransferase involved in cell wall biosynthesis